ncbi:phosphatidate cytidylyltransferase [Rhodohalobacter halophilus]|uniref:phosphatidate cytidylyltransferase n=1 Tax=Rhodohalobacter halophilus TaxID=1812810 RepID=UPI00083FCBD2|nr:phosphatidate cytidylyltransferase [Rhodohalobacter halophilus]
MSELAKRILVALPAAAFFIWMVWLGGAAFQITIFAVLLITVWEVHNMMVKTGFSDFFPVSLLLVLLLWSPPFIPWWLILTAAGVASLLTVIAVAGRQSDRSVRWLTTLFTGVYPTVGFMMLVNIRELGTTTIDGFWLTMTLLLMIWGNDVFAYFGGKSFGKHKLAPKISPKKTWEGFGFGFLGAAAGFLIAFFWADFHPLRLSAIIPAVVIVSIAGPLGDISASRVKRIAGVKDSSNILPGHGGLFDRFDSLLLSAPFIYFLYYLIL